MSLLPVSEAILRITDGVVPLPAEDVRLTEAAGRVLATPLKALRTQPPFTASAMDGYALRAEDGKAGARLRVVGESHAGNRYASTVGSGEAVRIFTGAPLPEGADAILIQENAERTGDEILVKQAISRGRHIRRRGLDFTEGQELIHAGRRLGFRDVALAASMNHVAIPVTRKPRVAFFATGDELVPPGGATSPDQIIASNSFGIAALVERCGGAPNSLGIMPDDAQATEAAIDRAVAERADVLVTLGGASVGERDLVRGALAARGMALDFWRIAMRPGMPLIFGRLGGVRVLGLPGNPVSSLVCATLFLQPLIAALLGEAVSDPTTPAVLGAEVPANDHRQDYLRAKLVERQDGLPVVTALPVQDSSMLAALAAADCLIVRPPNAPAESAEALCRIIRLG